MVRGGDLIGKDRPLPLPVQAPDHARGHVMAAAALTGLARRLDTGQGCIARTSLAGIAALLTRGPRGTWDEMLAARTATDFSDTIEATGWGPARRLRSPVTIGAMPLRWDIPAGPPGTAPAVWGRQSALAPVLLAQNL